MGIRYNDVTKQFAGMETGFPCKAAGKFCSFSDASLFASKDKENGVDVSAGRSRFRICTKPERQ